MIKALSSPARHQVLKTYSAVQQNEVTTFNHSSIIIVFMYEQYKKSI